MAQKYKKLATAAGLFALCVSTGFGSPVSANDSAWDRYTREGEAALGSNNYGVAERNFTQALAEAEKFSPKDLRVARSLKNLAALYCARGNFTKAEPLLERELRAREKALGGESSDVVAQVGKLTQFYLTNGTAAKADRMATLLLTFAQRKLKEQKAMDEKLKQLGGFYEKNPAYSEAKAELKRLQDISGKCTANVDLELASTLDTLGTLFKEKSKPAIAEEMYKTAMNLRETGLAPGHLALAQSYDHLAALYTAQGKTDLAQPYYKKALEVTEKTLQPERPEMFSRLDNLARTYVSQGHPALAEGLYKRALAILQKVGRDPGAPSYALAQLYVKQGRYGEAEPLLKRALASFESANGPQHAALLPVLDTYAEVLDKINRSGDASRLRNRARAIKGSTIVQNESDRF